MMNVDDAERIYEELFQSPLLRPRYSFSASYAVIENGVAALLREDGSALVCSPWREFRRFQLRLLAEIVGEHTLITLALSAGYHGGVFLPRETVLREAVCVLRHGMAPTLIDWDWFDTDDLRKVERSQAEAVIYGPVTAT